MPVKIGEGIFAKVSCVLYRTLGQNFNFNLGRYPHEISYKRCDYESVDEKSLS